jgi:hypothetical protein
MEMSGQLHAPAALPWCQFDRRLGSPQGRSGGCGEEKDLSPLPGIEPWPSSQYPIAIPSEVTVSMYILFIHDFCSALN